MSGKIKPERGAAANLGVMHSCRSLGKLVRPVREPSEGFGFKHSYCPMNSMKRQNDRILKEKLPDRKSVV